MALVVCSGCKTPTQHRSYCVVCVRLFCHGCLRTAAVAVGDHYVCSECLSAGICTHEFKALDKIPVQDRYIRLECIQCGRRAFAVIYRKTYWIKGQRVTWLYTTLPSLAPMPSQLAG